MTVLGGQILGLTVPAAGPVFAIALAMHVAAGLTALVTGGVAATAPKGAGRHQWAGRTYFRALTVVVATAVVMAAVRWSDDWQFAVIATVAFLAATTGHVARPSPPHARLPLHISGMGASYVALLTGFYVDNGPQLPLWNRLPAIAYWLLPTVVGVPLIVRALTRHRNITTSGLRLERRGSAEPRTH